MRGREYFQDLATMPSTKCLITTHNRGNSFHKQFDVEAPRRGQKEEKEKEIDQNFSIRWLSAILTFNCRKIIFKSKHNEVESMQM